MNILYAILFLTVIAVIYNITRQSAHRGPSTGPQIPAVREMKKFTEEKYPEPEYEYPEEEEKPTMETEEGYKETVSEFLSDFDDDLTVESENEVSYIDASEDQDLSALVNEIKTRAKKIKEAKRSGIGQSEEDKQALDTLMSALNKKITGTGKNSVSFASFSSDENSGPLVKDITSYVHKLKERIKNKREEHEEDEDLNV